MKNVSVDFKNYKLAIFDLDGVLINTKKLWFEVLKLAFKDFNVPAPSWEIFAPTFGQGTQADIQMWIPHVTVQELNDAYARHFVSSLHHVEVLEQGISLASQAKKMGLKTAIASNSDRRIINKIIKNLKIENLFDAFVGSTDVQNPKPSPDMIFKLLSDFNIDSSQAVFFGDSPYDQEAGGRAQVKTIIVDFL